MESTTDTVEIHEFNINEQVLHGTFLIMGPPGSGKTTFVRILSKYVAHLYPVARVHTSVAQTDREYSELFGPIYVHDEINWENEKQFVTMRQKYLAKQITDDSPIKRCLYVIDDIDTTAKGCNNVCCEDIFQKGSRHYNMLTFVINQNPMNFNPTLRTSASYIVFFNYNQQSVLDNIYKHYIPNNLFKDKKDFLSLYNQITTKHTCMIIKNIDTDSESSITDRIFYYYCDKELSESNIKFGCDEYKNYCQSAKL